VLFCPVPLVDVEIPSNGFAPPVGIDVESDFSAIYILHRRLIIFTLDGLWVKLDVVLELGGKRYDAIGRSLLKTTTLFVHVVHRIGDYLLFAGEENVSKNKES
jgi:hypothetical protein